MSTPEYTKKAISKYMSDKKRVTLILSEEEYKQIQELSSDSPGATIKKILLEYLNNK